MLKTLLLVLLLLSLAGCSAPSFEQGQQARQQGNLQEAATIWRKRAQAGDGRALYSLYRLYSATGVGFGNDAQARAALVALAEDYRQAPAQYLYAQKLLEERALVEGQKWMRRSAEGGYEEAQSFLEQKGELLSRRIRLLRGSPEQQFQLGNDLYFGHAGVDKDREEAAIWYRKAAGRGHLQAQAMLAYQYLNGEGVAKAPDQAYRWYREAAIQGLASAQGSLAYLYGAGLGTKRDDIKAYAWSVLASENGDAPAQANKPLYLHRLSNAQRLESLDEIRRLEAVIRPNASR